MAHGTECPGMTWLPRVVAIALITCVLTGCAPPAMPAGPVPPMRGANTWTLYLPRIARSPLSTRLFLPRVARRADGRQFFPSISKNYPICPVYGRDCAEPNGTRTQAVALTELNRPYYGTVYTATADAYDYFVVPLVFNRRYTMTLAGGNLAGTPFTGQNDADLYLYDALGNLLKVSAEYGQVSERILFTPTASGQYYLLAFAFHTPIVPAAYRLEVRNAP